MAKRKMPDETLIQIEETQAALRASIEKTKELAADSDRLIRGYRDEIAQPQQPKPVR